VRNYSLGMKQRLGLAAALLRQPRLLVLDEPTNGLDPHGIHEVRDLLAELNAGGVTVFLSSHLLAEVEQVCTTAAIVSQGRLVVQDRVSTLLAPTGRVFITTPDVATATSIYAGAQPTDDGVVVTLDGDGPAELNARLVAAGVRVEELHVERPTLEQVFLSLTAGSSDVPRIS
jgi:ABC-2 type transport system ATP-binding protein